MKTIFGEYIISDEQKNYIASDVKRLLDGSYWAPDRDLSIIEKTLNHSICIYVSHQNQLVGFARVVTDQVVFAWIADVIVDKNHRGNGLGKEIMSFIQNHPLIPSHLQLLRTKDAHGLYEKFGFKINSQFMCK